MRSTPRCDTYPQRDFSGLTILPIGKIPNTPFLVSTICHWSVVICQRSLVNGFQDPASDVSGR